MAEENGSDDEAERDGEADELGRLTAEVAELKDRLLRALADAENTRRRGERDRLEASQYAMTRFARDMLTIADNFGRALAACPPQLREAADPQVKAVIDGVEATERQLLSTLERYGVKQIDTSDAKFDPNVHQAIAEVPAEGKAPGTIVDVVQTGYRIGDRLLRPAMVTVARAQIAGQSGPTKIDTRQD
ncbi:MAG: nucleotide exchange factor GrpE [Alphaproteobacteria bacterium]|nr:nucleotide exchange factor GrpE [Alphaproteobacteria bacterium]